MSWALPTSRATAIDASKVCGSVLGLLMMALAWTYLPPTCWITSAYSFSAPTATIFPDELAPLALPEQAAATVAMTAATTASSKAAPGRFPATLRTTALLNSIWTPDSAPTPDGATTQRPGTRRPGAPQRSSRPAPGSLLMIIVSIISKQPVRRGCSAADPLDGHGKEGRLPCEM